MNSKEAIIAFSQGEKIKSGLIWINQVLELAAGLSPQDTRGAEETIKALVHMLANEILLSQKMAPDASWQEAAKHVDTALIMINSGVALDATYHLTQALSQVTGINQRSMSFLKEQALL